MKTPHEILLQKHRAALPKLDAIRPGLVERLAAGEREGFSWREMTRSLRWHLPALGAAWMLVILLNVDRSSTAAAIPGDKIPSAQQILASLRENRRLLLELTETPPETPAIPDRRGEIEPSRVEV
jgi:hypothetical protein